MVRHHQQAPWVRDSEVEDSKLSLQIKDAGFKWVDLTAKAKAGVPEGDYIVQAYVETEDGGVRSTSLVYVSRFRVGADGVLVLDARRSGLGRRPAPPAG